MSLPFNDPPDGELAPLPSQVYVLIIGSGLTGLTLAAQLGAFPGITTRIVEQRAGPLHLGQADGIACRTMEMFEAFRVSERVLRECYWVNETAFWSPDSSSRCDYPGYASIPEQLRRSLTWGQGAEMSQLW